LNEYKQNKDFCNNKLDNDKNIKIKNKINNIPAGISYPENCENFQKRNMA